MPLADQRLIWIDCEMTGLDPVKNRLLEIACIVTEGDLKVCFSYLVNIGDKYWFICHGFL